MLQLSPAALLLVLSLLLLLIEIIAPGYFLIWLGAAALMAGLIGFGVALNMVQLLALFLGLSVICVFLAARFFPYAQAKSESKLNSRTAQLIGMDVLVREDITAYAGRVNVGDSVWRAQGCVAQAGEIVRVVGASGNRLIVERV
jgi:inner membrane protein